MRVLTGPPAGDVDDAVATVRRLNRLITQQVGALDDRYLARERSLGASRVLWEIGERGCEVVRLRSRLALDSGHLSRLLRSLEADGLIEVTPADRDRRVRVAALTRAGRRERALLERRSDALVRSLLEPLTAAQRQRLVAAVSDVERLLTAAMVVIDAVDPAHRHAQHCLGQYLAELDRRFTAGFDPARSLPADLEDMRPPSGLFLLASLRDEPVGCGALKLHSEGPAEVKRMWVAPAARGWGLGRRLLAELEVRAREAGARTVHLETNGSLGEAIALYRASGYEEVEAFNDEPYAHHWFEKHLPPGD